MTDKSGSCTPPLEADHSDHSPLGDALNRLKRRVIEARERPPAPAPGLTEVQAIFDDADAARNTPSLRL